jgi:hypothetical protein
MIELCGDHYSVDYEPDYSIVANVLNVPEVYVHEISSGRSLNCPLIIFLTDYNILNSK